MRLDEILGPDDYAAINEAWARRWARLKTWWRERRAHRHATASAATLPDALEHCAPEGAWPSSIASAKVARGRATTRAKQEAQKVQLRMPLPLVPD